jgi:hypothetical protein
MQNKKPVRLFVAAAAVFVVTSVTALYLAMAGPDSSPGIVEAPSERPADGDRVLAIGTARVMFNDVATAEGLARKSARDIVISRALPKSRARLLAHSILGFTDQLVPLIEDEEWSPAVVKDRVVSVELRARLSPDVVDEHRCDHLSGGSVALVVLGQSNGGLWTSDQRFLESQVRAALVDACFSIVESPLTVAASENGDLAPHTRDEILRATKARWLLIVSTSVKPTTDEKAALARDYNASTIFRLVDSTTLLSKVDTRRTALLWGSSAANALQRADNTAPVIVEPAMNVIIDAVYDDIDLGPVELLAYDVDSFGEAEMLRNLIVERFAVDQREVKNRRALYSVATQGESLALLVDGKRVRNKVVEVIEASRGRVVVRLVSR